MNLGMDDIDRIADVIWWLKGYRAAVNDNSLQTYDITEDHLEALRRARVLALKNLKEGESK